MIFNSAEFIFEAPLAVSRSRRVLIKPSAGYPLAYPASTSREMLASIIMGVRQVSDADILILEGTPSGQPVAPIYKSLGYDFPRVLTLDVRDTTLVEVENPLVKPLVMPTFQVPNVILSSDFLISVAPLKVVGGHGWLSIANLLGILPSARYGNSWQELYQLDINRILADLYYTMPFDLGIIEASKRFVSSGDPNKGEVTDYGKVFVGEPYQVDRETSAALNIKTEYLKLIDEARVDLEV